MNRHLVAPPQGGVVEMHALTKLRLMTRLHLHMDDAWSWVSKSKHLVR